MRTSGTIQTRALPVRCEPGAFRWPVQVSECIKTTKLLPRRATGECHLFVAALLTTGVGSVGLLEHSIRYRGMLRGASVRGQSFPTAGLS